MLHMRVARYTDAVTLAPRLRYADAREIATMWGIGAQAGLMACLLHSDRAFAVLDERDDLVALWGVSDASVASLRIGVPWLLGSDRLFTRRRALIRHSRPWLALLLAEYDVLRNVTDAANVAHRRWLRWCGFAELRRHDRYGAAQRPCVEFYRISEARCVSATAVESTLTRQRLARPSAPLDHAAGPLAELALRVFSDGWHDDRVVPLLDSLQTLDRAIRAGQLGARLARRSVTLAEELAQALLRTLPGRVRRRHRDAPWLEFCQALNDVAQTRLLAGAQPMAAPEAPAARHPLDTLLRRHAALLTESGHLSAVQGWRLRRVAAAGGREDAFLPAPRRRELEDACRSAGLAQALVAGGSRRSSAVGAHWRDLLALPLRHGAVMGALRGVAAAGSVVDVALRRRLDAWALADGADTVPRQLDSVGALLAAAGALADAVSRAVLPEVRLGGVVAGQAERLWLWRLLRACFIDAACAGHAQVAITLLHGDVVALLMAAALEDAWLEEPAAAPWPERTSRLSAALLRPLGTAFEVDDDASLLLTWLLPVLTTPVVHGLELPAALAVWHAAVRGGLTAMLLEVGEFLGDDAAGSRRPLRDCLRRLSARPDMVDVRRLFGLERDLERPGAHAAGPPAATAPA